MRPLPRLLSSLALLVTTLCGVPADAQSPPALLQVIQGPCCSGGVGHIVAPRGIAFAADGTLLFVDMGNAGLVQSISATGVISRFATTGGQPSGVAIDSHGNVFVCDALNNAVYKFSSAGIPLRVWGGTLGNAPGQFQNPLGIAVDALDNVYVADTVNGRIQEFTNDGAFLTSFGVGPTGSWLGSPYALVFDPADNLYAAVANPARVVKLDHARSLVTSWTTSGTPEAIAIDSGGELLVGDSQLRAVFAYALDGTPLFQWTDNGASGHPFRPRGLATDPSGRVAIADDAFQRVLLYGPQATPVAPQSWGSLKARYR